MLLVRVGSMVGIDIVPMLEKYEEALKGDRDFDNRTAKLGEFNVTAYKVLILSINTSSAV